MTRLALLLAVLCLAACGSNGTATSTTTTSRPRASTSAPTTTRPVTTTTHLSATVADQFTQAALASAIEAAKSAYGRDDNYTALTPASLAALLPQIHFGTIDQASSTVVGVFTQDKHDVLLATRSLSGHWYCVIDNTTDGVSYGSGTSRGAVDSNGECQKPAWSAPGQTPPPF